MSSRPPFPTGVAVFAGVYVLGFGGLAIFQGNSEFIFYLVIMLILIGTVYWIHTRVGFSRPVLWLLAVWGLLHMAGGTVGVPVEWAETDKDSAVLYSLRPWPFLPKYDQVTHAFGFFVATLAAGEALVAATRPERIGIGFAAACALVGVGLGAVNEVIEFVAVLILPETNVGGYLNTGWDLVANSLGAILAAGLILLRDRPTDPLGSSGGD